MVKQILAKDYKFIKGFSVYGSKKTTGYLKKYYKNKYNAESVVVTWGLESKRENKVGSNYEVLIMGIKQK